MKKYEDLEGMVISLLPLRKLAIRIWFCCCPQYFCGGDQLRPISTSVNFWMLNFGTTKCGAPKGGAPKGGAQKGGAQKRGAPKGGGPEGWSPERWGPKISRFFFPVPPQNSFFFALSGGLLVEFWLCLKRRGPEMCTFGVLGLSCASPGGPVWWAEVELAEVEHRPKR